MTSAIIFERNVKRKTGSNMSRDIPGIHVASLILYTHFLLTNMVHFKVDNFILYMI